MLNSYNPKSSDCNKIPTFDELNFTAWKPNAMEVLGIMDYDMIDIINMGLIVFIHQSFNDGASNSELKKKYVPGYNKE